jgi:NADPH:quinone reductase-like Zn-dependent oxidoreductase
MSVLSKILTGIGVVVLLAVATLAVALSHNSACATAPSDAIAQPMKAAVQRCYGSPDVVHVENIARPIPAEHELLIRVHESSVNPLDWHFMRGEPYLMRSQSGWGTPSDILIGTDFAGTVAAVGRFVTRFKPGDEVFGTGDGAFGQYIRSKDDAALALRPADVTVEQAAALPIAGVTALQAVRDVGQLRAGQKVLINGAGGGVGTFAVQIAKALGGEVTAVTNTASQDLMRSIGADHIIDYTREDFTQNGVHYDLIVDSSGTQSLRQYRRALAPTGIYVLAGNTDKGHWLGPLTGFGVMIIESKFVSQKLATVMAHLTGADLVVLAELVHEGKIKPVIDRRYSLDQVADAIRYQETGHARGKVMVTVD